MTSKRTDADVVADAIRDFVSSMSPSDWDRVPVDDGQGVYEDAAIAVLRELELHARRSQNGFAPEDFGQLIVHVPKDVAEALEADYARLRPLRDAQQRALLATAMTDTFMGLLSSESTERQPTQNSRCPRCGSHDIDGDFVEVFGMYCFQACDCHECGLSWRDTYELLGPDEFEEGGGFPCP